MPAVTDVPKSARAPGDAPPARPGRSRGPSFGHGYTAYWWTQFSGDYLFHSILYYEGTYTVKDGTLGGHVSHAGSKRLKRAAPLKIVKII